MSKEVEARGGAACILLVGINNLDVIEKQYDKAVIDELMSGIGAKLRQLVRPLDVVTRPEANMFAVTMLQPDIENCTSTSFRRIFDNLYMHSFKTSEGFIPVVVGVSLVAADTRTTIPDPRTFMRTAYDALTRSFDTGIITVVRYGERVESPSHAPEASMPQPPDTNHDSRRRQRRKRSRRRIAPLASSAPQFAALGDIDELNCAIGIVVDQSRRCDILCALR